MLVGGTDDGTDCESPSAGAQPATHGKAVQSARQRKSLHSDLGHSRAVGPTSAARILLPRKGLSWPCSLRMPCLAAISIHTFCPNFAAIPSASGRDVLGRHLTGGGCCHLPGNKSLTGKLANVAGCQNQGHLCKVWHCRRPKRRGRCRRDALQVARGCAC